MIENLIFKKSVPDFNKLIDYGFIYENDKYVYETNILNCSFKVVIYIYSNYSIEGHIYDLELDDEYVNYRVENNIGEFAGTIRNIYENLLTDIKNKCFISQNFSSPQANRISKLIYDNYDDVPFFEWESTPDAGVFKNKDTKKWYALVMNIKKEKIDSGDEFVDIINLKLDPNKIISLIKEKGYYPAYHMNKKYWITICFDESINDCDIFELIKESYSYSCGNKNNNSKNEWIVPANPKYYDIDYAFSNSKIIDWKQSSNINVGDVVYIYVAAPVSALKYKCVVRKNNIPYSYVDSNIKIRYIMQIELLDVYSDNLYSFSKLKEFGVNAIRGPRSMPINLSNYINKVSGGSDVGKN